MNQQWQNPEHGGPSSNTSRNALIAGLVVIIVSLLGTLLYVSTRSTDTTVGAATSSEAEFVVQQVAVPPPVFEPKGSEGEDPFFPIDDQVQSLYRRVRGTPQVTQDAIETGLYGGTVENTCDPERLIEYLLSHPDKARAWAATQDIEVGQIAPYIRSLDVRVLAEPAVAINHGFDVTAASATAIETTFDAGTAVLVDEAGDIRVRCYCGNPITPKPIEYRPPRCVVVPVLVATSPAGPSHGGNPTDVVLTGNAATSDTETWIEVEWTGASGVETGWTPASNLGAGVCVAPPIRVGNCAAVGAAVWADPSTTSQIGRLGGQVRTADTSTDMAAMVIPVADGTGIVQEAGFALVEFTRAAPATSDGAWVRASDLTGAGCGSVSACINTEGAVKDRAGGFTVRASGTYPVTFTGHFAAYPVSSAEVRFSDGSGTGWISNFYTPQPEAACDTTTPPGEWRCVAADTSAVADPTDSSEDGAEAVVAWVRYAEVRVLDGVPETNGRTQVQLGPGGPTGWIDTSAFGESYQCGSQRHCVEFLNEAWSVYPRLGAPLAGTEPGVVTMIDSYGITISGETGVHFAMGHDGQRGWAGVSGIVPQPFECETTDPVIGTPLCVLGAVYRSDIAGTTEEIAEISGATIVGQVGSQPGEGRIQIQVGPNGPFGWIDEADEAVRDESECLGPAPHCISPSEAFASPSENSEPVGIPNSPITVLMRAISVYDDGPSGNWKSNNYQGQDFWVRNENMYNGPEGECTDEAAVAQQVEPRTTLPECEEGQCCITGYRLSGSEYSIVFRDPVNAGTPIGEVVEGGVTYFEFGPVEGISDEPFLVRVPDHLADGCGSSPPPTTFPATTTPVPSPTATTFPPTATPVPSPTPTTFPPTATPVPSPTPVCDDVDADGICDAVDSCIDSDRDLFCDDQDTCPDVVDYDQLDTDGDGLGDACDDCPTSSNSFDCYTLVPTPTATPGPSEPGFDPLTLVCMPVDAATQRAIAERYDNNSDSVEFEVRRQWWSTNLRDRPAQFEMTVATIAGQQLVEQIRILPLNAGNGEARCTP